MSKEDYFTHKGQNIMKSTTIILNQKPLTIQGWGIKMEGYFHTASINQYLLNYSEGKKEVKRYQ